MAKTFKVAVYGTLMAGERNERWASDALDRRPCVLRGTLYDTGWGYPAFVPDADGGEVKAELLTVTEATLARMDELEGYPSSTAGRPSRPRLRTGASRPQWSMC